MSKWGLSLGLLSYCRHRGVYCCRIFYDRHCSVVLLLLKCHFCCSHWSTPNTISGRVTTVTLKQYYNTVLTKQYFSSTQLCGQSRHIYLFYVFIIITDKFNSFVTICKFYSKRHYFPHCNLRKCWTEYFW